MKLVADENIPLVRELFAEFGELVLRPGRAIDAATVRDADALLIRSVTRVDASLIAGSRLRFVASATIGTDHVDQTALAAHGIGFANAPGCNATAVAEYVLASLLVLAERGKFAPGKDVIGILGYGNVGSRLAAKLTALDWPFRVCDPFVPAARLPGGGVTAAQLLDADVLTLHVPLQRAGDHPTHHWLNADSLASSRARVIINSCRGPVVDNDALQHWLRADAAHAAVLDVWEREPDVPQVLLDNVDLATPHIAGHSREGKLNGSFMIHAAFCQHFGFDAGAAARWQLPPAGQGQLQADTAPAQLLAQLLHCYDPRHDDAAMRGALSAADDRRVAFDWLRKHYPERRELMSWQYRASADLAERYRALAGFVAP
ncbi:MAG TPA: 4-phosphoerythronate dehydrogenase [Permianibacter sp.]|nr:4-phosphoerythronate dehydrogenase [Permianibacter sp.]